MITNAATALVTGATGAIGRAIAHALAAEGAHVAVAGRRDRALRDLAASLPGGYRHLAIAGDLRKRAALPEFLASVQDAVGPLDILVNNAAVEHCSAFDQLTTAEIDEIITVNLTAPLELTRLVTPGMLARGHGHVVFISSLSGYAGTAYQAPYAATKGALNALVQSLRAEYAHRPIGFSLVAPGSVGGEGMFARGQADGIRVPRALRLTTANDVAHAVVRAIRTDAPQTLVYPGPIKPSLALGVLAPKTAERLNQHLGIATLFRPAAETRGRV